ncbi:hypothetical protein AERO_00660 [Aeromicrobium fastidiosum]|uniref:hypothetical protein n=1 Tax=Aeromicrobium fastidiosum TaxID=52699 RepID=UPI00202368B8|nr:hypothetical protein [Aeromicrobium fastidiosum]MCL8249880.1 hypothetical protein [Aeromicrobium fastidiosum]
MRRLMTRACCAVLVGLVAGACTDDAEVLCPEVLRYSTLDVSFTEVSAAAVAKVRGTLCDEDMCGAPAGFRVVDGELLLSFRAAADPVTYDLAFLDGSGALLADAHGAALGHVERPSGRRCPRAWNADVLVP